jgi:phospholipid/cholesterol/gamma-HCH transport system permease protein
MAGVRAASTKGGSPAALDRGDTSADLPSDQSITLAVEGRWTTETAGALFARVVELAAEPRCSLHVDLSKVEELDTTGAWLLWRTQKRFEQAGQEVCYAGLQPAHRELLELVRAHDVPCPVEPDRPAAWLVATEYVGHAVASLALRLWRGLSFLGLFVVALARTLRRPRRLPIAPLVHHMGDVSLPAMPVVALIGFLIGVVIAYQGAVQLSQFGAEVFVVDLVTISVLREIGILLTAIVVAGRSGSAFAAEIGAMSLNEEIDAMRTIGLDPMERLVVPRVLALVVMLPILTLISDWTALLGGAVASWSFVGLAPSAYVARVRDAAWLSTFLVGIVKAPVFGAVVALAGCHEGLEVRGGAAELGTRTTRSVVEAIFLVIVLDAVFSVFFANVGF